ncbi:hypothetical protein [Motilibacter rhizosphaerae]|nr:hypothetical protein [Motilibacter rhizosphaerae]
MGTLPNWLAVAGAVLVLAGLVALVKQRPALGSGLVVAGLVVGPAAIVVLR